MALAGRGRVRDDSPMNWSWTRALSLAGLVVAVACSLDTGGLGDEAPPVVKGEVAEKSGTDICGLYFRCSCDDLDQNPYTSEEQCANAVEAGVQAQVDEGDAADLEYDAACAGQILEALDGLGCDLPSEQGVGGLVGLVEDLQCKIFFGDDEVGENCTSLQLSDGDSCVRDAWCNDGLCEAIEAPPGPGDDCIPQTQEWNELCSGGSYCIDADQTGDHVCEVLPGKSDTCLGVADLCAEGYTCKQTTKTCTEAPETGEQCASTLFECAQGLYCHSSDKCVALPPVGEACADVPDGAPSCASGLTCEAGVCVREAPVVCGVGPVIFQPLP